MDDALSSAAAGLLLSDSKLGCFQAAPSASPPPQLWLWQGQGGAAAAANRASLRLVSRAFPFGCDAPRNCPSSTGFGVVPHHPSRSPSLLPSSEEVRYGISGSGKRRRTAQESKVLQANLGIWGLRRHDWLCWRSHLCTELVSCLTDLCKS